MAVRIQKQWETNQYQGAHPESGVEGLSGEPAQKEYQVCRAGWIGDYVDPNTFMDIVTDGGKKTGWSTRTDRLIGEAGRELDTQKRWQIFQEAKPSHGRCRSCPSTNTAPSI